MHDGVSEMGQAWLGPFGERLVHEGASEMGPFGEHGADHVTVPSVITWLVVH